MNFKIIPLLLLSFSAIPAVTHAQPSPDMLAAVRNPRVPKSIKFADKKVDLDRIDMFERLDRELTSMSYTHGNTLLTIKRANRYFPEIAPILKDEGVPADLIYLAVIESSMNPRAVSPAKAAGFWQFMPATGKEYGLEVNNDVDERFDLEKSTRAAARYLRSAYKKYGNWESAAASYNGGQGRISSELSAQNQTSAYDLWLVDETTRYMFRLLAAKMIIENPADYGYILHADQLYQPLDYKVIEVTGPVADWRKWASDNGTTYMTLREHNPWIRNKSMTSPVPGKVYKVRIPTEQSQRRSTVKTKVYNKNWVNR